MKSLFACDNYINVGESGDLPIGVIGNALANAKMGNPSKDDFVKIQKI